MIMQMLINFKEDYLKPSSPLDSTRLQYSAKSAIL